MRCNLMFKSFKKKPAWRVLCPLTLSILMNWMLNSDRLKIRELPKVRSNLR